jgi:hypothetical protein
MLLALSAVEDAGAGTLPVPPQPDKRKSNVAVRTRQWIARIEKSPVTSSNRIRRPERARRNSPAIESVSDRRLWWSTHISVLIEDIVEIGWMIRFRGCY